MDAASWRCLDALFQWNRQRSPPKIDPLRYVTGRAPLVILRGFSSVTRLEYETAYEEAERNGALVEIGTLDEDEALAFVAEELGVPDPGLVRDNDAVHGSAQIHRDFSDCRVVRQKLFILVENVFLIFLNFFSFKIIQHA